MTRKSLPAPQRPPCHLADLIPVMAEVARESYAMSPEDIKGRKFNQFRNYVFSQATIMTLYNLYSIDES